MFARLYLFCTAVCLLSFPQGAAVEPPRAVLDARHRTFLKEHCVACHNADKQKGKVRLDDISFAMDSVEKADLWQKVLNSINSGEMPPEEEKQPAAAAKADLLDDLSHTLVAARSSLGDAGGVITMRRLNKREYKNTIRDLLGVEVGTDKLPADGGSGNFDTVGSSLFMSPDQLEQYLALGRQAVDDHFARYVTAAPVESLLKQRREVEAKANFDVAGVYNGYFKGRYEAAKKLLETGVPQRGIPDKQDAKFAIQNFEEHAPSYERYLKDPLNKSGSLLTLQVRPAEPFAPPAGAVRPGNYLLRIRVGAVKGTPKERHFLELGGRMKPDDRDEFTLIRTLQVTGTTDTPQIIETMVNISGEAPRQYVLREKRDTRLDFETYQAARRLTKVGPPPALWVDWVEWEGPIMRQEPASAKTFKERREVELQANAGVSGLYNGYFKGGFESAKRFLETGKPQHGIPDAGEAKFRIHSFNEHGPSFESYLNDPLTKTGALLTTFQVHTWELISLPPDWPAGWKKVRREVESAVPGEYVLRFRIGAVKGTPKQRHFIQIGSRIKPDDREDFTLMQTFQVTGTTDEPQVIEVPVSIRAEGPRTFVLREKRDVNLDFEKYMASIRKTKVGPPPALWIDWVEWEGPLLRRAENDLPVKPIMSAGDSDARGVLEGFARRAYRGKAPSAAFMMKLLQLYERRRNAGESHEVALRLPLSVILASPGFLYLRETGRDDRVVAEQPGKTPGAEVRVPLSNAELASRLSYFLWSAPPDEALLKADLKDPAVLAREVDRMISSPKADEFVVGFVHQWLGMERLDFFRFNTKQFQDFDDSAKAAARREVYETFAHLLRDHGSLTKLLKSDEIYVNGLLATYYGIEGVTGDHFRKVRLPAGSPRGGLLGMAAILAMGSNGERTSPVERGAWVLRKLLHDPPPPAPPNVPQLDRLSAKPLSPRDRLVAHQENPQCLQCHRKIDPVGFGLENFDAAGKWREQDYDPKTKKTWPIDPRGQFHKGPAFRDYFELRDLIASKDEKFARGFTEALIEYSLGRPYGFTDAPLADLIVKDARGHGWSIRQFIIALVSSPEFARK